MNLMHLPPLERRLSQFRRSEFTGIDSSDVYYPKSIPKLRGPALRYALSGIIRAWSTSNTSSGIYMSDSTTLDSSANPEFYEFLLYFWLLRFNSLSAAYLLPIFKSKSEYREFIVGKVDFPRYELEACSRTQLGFFCEYNNLSFDLPYYRVIKDGYRDLLRRLNKNDLLISGVFRLIYQGLQLVNRVPHSNDFIRNAMVVREKADPQGRIIGLPQKVLPLSELIQFFSAYILKEDRGVSPGISFMQGILFNLNYLMEYILRRSLRSTYSNFEIQKNLFSGGAINKVHFRQQGNIANLGSMRPDCKGVFSKFNDWIPASLQTFFEGKIYIFDAKHKVFSSNDELERIGRDDLYQIISYSATHNNLEARQGIYGLVGLETESTLELDDNFKMREYIKLDPRSKTGVVLVESDKRTTEVLQIPFRFGQFLHDLGKVGETNQELIYQRAGINLLQAVFQALRPLRSTDTLRV